MLQRGGEHVVAVRLKLHLHPCAVVVQLVHAVYRRARLEVYALHAVFVALGNSSVEHGIACRALRNYRVRAAVRRAVGPVVPLVPVCRGRVGAPCGDERVHCVWCAAYRCAATVKESHGVASRPVELESMAEVTMLVGGECLVDALVGQLYGVFCFAKALAADCYHVAFTYICGFYAFNRG